MAKTSTLPPRVFQKHGAYYCVYKNTWTRLGKTEAEMLAAYDKISTRADDVKQKHVAKFKLQMAAMRAVVSPRMRLMIDLLFLTGESIGDILALRRGAILPEGLAFKLEQTGARLALAWIPALRQCIDSALALHGALPRVTTFFGRASKPADYRTVGDQWEAGCVLAGVVDAHLDDIRAKSLTDASRKGRDAQALGGHASAAMTDRYIRLRDTPLVHDPSGLSKSV